MMTRTLNALQQTRRLGHATSTGVYDDGELEFLLNETAGCTPGRVRGAKTLSPELMAQILDGKFILSNANGEGDEKESRFD